MSLDQARAMVARVDGRPRLIVTDVATGATLERELGRLSLAVLAETAAAALASEMRREISPEAARSVPQGRARAAIAGLAGRWRPRRVLCRLAGKYGPFRIRAGGRG